MCLLTVCGVTADLLCGLFSIAYYAITGVDAIMSFTFLALIAAGCVVIRAKSIQAV